MRAVFAAFLAVISVLVVSRAEASDGQRDFPVADKPSLADVYPQRVTRWPGGVTSLADVTYSTLPGYRPMVIDIYQPQKRGGPKPLVLYIHGGGWVGGHTRHSGALSNFPAVLASLARSAEMLGIMERMLAETQEYLRTRNQFGTSLGKFQAIQHRMVTQYTVIEQGRALLNLAQVSWGKPEFARAVAGVRAYLALNAIELGHEMIQFHGGMGVTDELSVGGAHKRLLLLSRWPVDPDTALDCFAEIAA